MRLAELHSDIYLQVSTPPQVSTSLVFPLPCPPAFGLPSCLLTPPAAHSAHSRLFCWKERASQIAADPALGTLRSEGESRQVGGRACMRQQ